MLTEERQELIKKIISQEGVVRSKELTERLNVSESTIRRDLEELEVAGFLKRIHGGAQQIVKLDSEPSMAQKNKINMNEKKKIAQLASQLIKKNDFIYLDAGTTTFEMIPYLKDLNVTVVTNSIYHANALADMEVDVIILGGGIKRATKAIISQLAREQLSHYYFDKAFMGMNGVHPEFGYTTPDPEEASMKKAAFSQAQQVFVLADEAKFNKVSFTEVAELNKATIITDKIPNELAEELRGLTTVKDVRQ